MVLVLVLELLAAVDGLGVAEKEQRGSQSTAEGCSPRSAVVWGRFGVKAALGMASGWPY